TSLAPGNIVDYSESDESPISKTVDVEVSAGKNVSEDPDVVIMNETTVSDKSLPTNSEASVARRTRSRAGKGVETANTPVQTPKPTRSAKGTGKKPLYGPPKPVSKVIPRNEEKQKVKKRKAPPTSDSEFEPETDVAASGSTSRKSIGRKKVPRSVPYAPLDNVSFHLENGSARWKFVYHRRLALERNLKEDILQCQNVVEAIEYAGLMKTVCGLDKCYDRLVKEFFINVAENCDDPASPEYRQVFVRGKCVKLSPTVINQYLQRNTKEVADLKVTDNEVCKVITGGRLKVWPTKAKLAATSLSPLYAILNRVSAHNWVPTTHSGDVARGLGKFIYIVGTKAKFDYGTYFFHETLSHAMTYAVEKPVAFPTLLCNVILEQHPDILRSTDVPC
ncbi:envelope-like protein, partial [Trifolium pratense]